MKKAFIFILLFSLLFNYCLVFAQNDSPPIPEGFVFVEGSIDKGFVIKDKAGNQFVWVPVTQPLRRLDWKYQRVSVSDSAEEMPAVITESISKYKGFYVARYETTRNDKAIVKSVSNIWVGISWVNVDWYTAKWACEKMAADYNYKNAVTHLIYDSEWDAIIQWLKESNIDINDSRKYGNYIDYPSFKNKTGPNNPIIPGIRETAKTNNIFDLAGNFSEWTMGKTDPNSRIVRGGSYTTSGLFHCISSRDAKYITTAEPFLGFRPAIVISE